MIDRRQFLSDYRLKSPSRSHLLFNAVYSVASPFLSDEEAKSMTNKDTSPNKLAITFRRMAKLNMENDYFNPKISTIQALLLLGSQKNLPSDANLNWLRSGMAIRMVSLVC